MSITQFQEKGSKPLMNPLTHRNQSSTGNEATACSVHECDEQAALVLETRALCMDHLVSYCYSRLQECEEGDRAKQSESASGGAPENALTFLDDCRGRIASLLIIRTDLSNIERARLLDIILWASEIIEKRRRKASARQKNTVGIHFD